MAMQYESYYCENCKKHTLHFKPKAHNGIGCLGTLLTGGLAAPIWLAHQGQCAFEGYRCNECGQVHRET